MNGDEIRLSLKDLDISFTDIAKALEVTPQSVSAVAHRKGDSASIAKAICIALGKPVEEVFEDRPQYQRHVDTKERKRRLDKIQRANAA